MCYQNECITLTLQLTVVLQTFTIELKEMFTKKIVIHHVHSVLSHHLLIN